MPLTDEQMTALPGGKSKAATVGAEVGGTAGSIAAVLGVLGMAVTLMVKYFNFRRSSLLSLFRISVAEPQ